MVAYDTFGGGSTGTTGSTTYSYTHTLGSISAGAVLAGIAVDSTADGGLTCTCTFGGTSMTSLAKIHCNGAATGFLQVFGLATGSSTGAQTVTATVAGGTPVDMEGGSLSFSGANQAAPFGTPATGASVSTTASATTGGSTSGNIVGGFMASGSAIASATAPSSSKFIDNYQTSGNQAAGCAAGATSSGTGSAVTMAWTLTSDSWAAIIVEVLSSALSVPAGAAAAGAVAPGALTIPYASVSGPNYPALAVDKAGGAAGFWRNAVLAEGAP